MIRENEVYDWRKGNLASPSLSGGGLMPNLSFVCLDLSVMLLHVHGMRSPGVVDGSVGRSVGMGGLSIYLCYLLLDGWSSSRYMLYVIHAGAL